MIFVTGPLFAGKEEYIKSALCLTDEEFRTCAVRDVQELAVDAGDLAALADKLSAFRVVIATEIGGGVVPTDERQRQEREAAGRLACLLSEHADTVVRVCCGLPQVLKGKI